MDSRSSVEASPIGAFVSWLLASAASAQFALFLEGVLGKTVWFAWGIALLAFGWGAQLASNPGKERNLISAQVALMVSPVVLLVAGLVLSSPPLSSFSGAFLGIFAVGWGLAVPVAQWISGNAPARPDGRPPSLPLPGASFAIALFFALPSPRMGSAIAGMAAIAALVLAASLGAISSRSSEGGTVASAPLMWTRWTGAALLLAASAGLVGFVLTNAIRPTSLLGVPTDLPQLAKEGRPAVTPGNPTTGSVSPNPEVSGSGTTPPTPTPTPNTNTNTNPGGGTSDAGASPKSEEPRPESPPERDWREYLRLAAIALLALAALALAKRYGDRIQAFLERVFGRLAAPFARLTGRWQTHRTEARLWQEALTMPDPFAAPGSVAARSVRLEATLAALGTARRPEEPPALYLRRASLLLGGDPERWRAATLAINRSRFGAPSNAEEEIGALVALDDEMSERLAALPDAEARRRRVRLTYARERFTSPPEPAPL